MIGHTQRHGFHKTSSQQKQLTLNILSVGNQSINSPLLSLLSLPLTLRTLPISQFTKMRRVVLEDRAPHCPVTHPWWFISLAMCNHQLEVPTACCRVAVHIFNVLVQLGKTGEKLRLLRLEKARRREDSGVVDRHACTHNRVADLLMPFHQLRPRTVGLLHNDGSERSLFQEFQC